MTLTTGSRAAGEGRVDGPAPQASPSETSTSSSPSPSSSSPRPAAPLDSRTVGPAIALVMGMVGVLFFGFLAYLVGFSGVSEARAQHSLRQSMFTELANAVAPTGPTAIGRPVAVLDVPVIGIHNLVVVEGTSTRTLMAGPGHLPATVLPGQAGVSTIFGKRSTFGAPFSRLMSLQIGDVITATTGQGVSRYRVSSFGDVDQPAPANSANRLVLITAAKSWWPRAWVMVSADLVTAVQPSSGSLPVASTNQAPLARDSGESLIPLAAWSQLLLLIAIVGTVAWFRAPRWPVVLCVGPLVVAALWCVFENAAGLLPNLL